MPKSLSRYGIMLIFAAALVGCGPPLRQTTTDPGIRRPPPPQLIRDAERLAPFVEQDLSRQFLRSAAQLPGVDERTLYRSAERGYLTAADFAALPEPEQSGFEPWACDEMCYYTTRYGTPMAYARALDIAARHGFENVAGKRVLDFGYGMIGHLRMLASLGGDVVGVEVDPKLQALYSAPGDQGAMGRGQLRLVHGSWPGDANTRGAVGAGYDLILSKNVLKRGYVHPAREVNPRMLVHLGVDDAAFADALYETLNPGGLVLFYNLSPKLSAPDEPYRPWSDGRCPFDREVLQHSGFEVLVYDQVDDEAARRMARLLRWDTEQGMDVDGDLFAHFTILRKP